jgi:hypothetical protein
LGLGVVADDNRWLRWFARRPLHAIHVNSYNDYVEIENPWSVESAQYQWVAADLAAVDRAKTPWVAVFLHAPWCVPSMRHSRTAGKIAGLYLFCSFVVLLSAASKKYLVARSKHHLSCLLSREPVHIYHNTIFTAQFTPGGSGRLVWKLAAHGWLNARLWFVFGKRRFSSNQARAYMLPFDSDLQNNASERQSQNNKKKAKPNEDTTHPESDQNLATKNWNAPCRWR